MTGASRQEQIAEHQIGFRRTNQNIYATAIKHGLTGQIPFVCECADLGCTAIIQLNANEYQATRRHPRGFFNISGHEAPAVAAGAERVIAVIKEFTMVMKIGRAGELATHATTFEQATQQAGSEWSQ